MTRHNFETEDQEYVDELRNRLKGELTAEMFEDTRMFIRFLRARNYDLKAAEHMLRNYVNWNREHKADSILSWYTPNEVTETYIPLHNMGFDKEGSPVSYLDFGNMDLRGLVKSVSTSKILNFIIFYLESDVKRVKEQSAKMNKKVEQWIHVFNFDKFPLSIATHKPSMELIGKLVSLYEGNYPEMLKTVYVINTSWYFQIAYAIVKPLITGQTLKKIRIYGTDGWKEDLLNAIDADTLPAFLGGNLTDPDGDLMCRTIIKHGAPVPEKYFAVNNKNNFTKQPGVKTLIVKRFAKEKVKLVVLYPGSDIEWEFTTKAKDISFSLVYKGNPDSDLEEDVLPSQKCDASISPEVGMFKCDKAGIYYLQFDNKYSWIYQKEIYYKVQIINPRDKIHSV